MDEQLSEATNCIYKLGTLINPSPLPVLYVRYGLIGKMVNNNKLIKKVRREFGLGVFFPNMIDRDGCGFGRCLSPNLAGGGCTALVPTEKLLAGIQKQEDWRKVTQLIASYCILFDFLYENRQHVETSDSPQLFTVNISINAHGHWKLKAFLSTPLVRWLTERQSSDIKQAKETMVNLYTHLRGMRSAEDSNFNVHIVQKNRHLLISCPEQCELKPDPPIRRNNGYIINSHNIKNGIELLTLLSGLAKLEMLVRKEGIK